MKLGAGVLQNMREEEEGNERGNRSHKEIGRGVDPEVPSTERGGGHVATATPK